MIHKISYTKGMGSNMKKETSGVTMKDVAKEAGVALGTVSRVVNGLPVGDSYKIRVEDAIRKLDYQVCPESPHKQNKHRGSSDSQYQGAILCLSHLPYQSCAVET